MLFLLATMIAASPSQLVCIVSRGKVEISVPAGADPEIDSVAVVRSGKWATIADEEHRLASFRAGVRRLALPLSTQQAVEYRDGKAHVVKAFPSRGLYRIVLADNLETEEENMSALSCSIRLP